MFGFIEHFPIEDRERAARSLRRSRLGQWRDENGDCPLVVLLRGFCPTLSRAPGWGLLVCMVESYFRREGIDYPYVALSREVEGFVALADDPVGIDIYPLLGLWRPEPVLTRPIGKVVVNTTAFSSAVTVAEEILRRSREQPVALAH